MRPLTRLLHAVLAVTAVAGPAVAADPILLRFSHVTSESSPKGIGAARLQALVEERLAGRVKVEVYPNAERYDDDEVLRALLFGDVELAAPSLAKFRAFTKRLQVFDLPFLFSDVAAVKRFQFSPEGFALLDATRERGLKGLAFWDNGMRVMSASRPIRRPEDVEGLVFRIEPSPVIEAQYERLGAVPFRLPFARVYDALASGLVDGQENAWSNIHSKRFHELTPELTETRHSFLGYLLVTRTGLWDGLPADVRTALQNIIKEVTLEVNQIAVEKAEQSRGQVVAAGARVHELTVAEREAWVSALRPIWDRFEDEIGAETLAAAKAAASR